MNSRLVNVVKCLYLITIIIYGFHHSQCWQSAVSRVAGSEPCWLRHFNQCNADGNSNWNWLSFFLGTKQENRRNPDFMRHSGALFNLTDIHAVVEYRTRNREVAGSTHTRSTASNLEQVANLLCAQANSASYPQWDRKWVVATATGWRPRVADWGDSVSASCTVGPIVR